ncbi:enoyl-CoA hydratase-related protein [Bradyrhizobium sp. CCBAU 11386]|uniref:enoyl-CoA hydratase-related protein n=1 Tax=Bradyrhizobium sp. CCBAU 11386 TaxID=1630837 RepID=UPI002303B006|nr:enoyl-CoA hydratase-related protein [Bradyrhizobium sp. CCBAU 11386]
MTSDNPVTYERAGNIARITLRRPPVNALSLEVIRAVVAALRRAADDQDARVVVLASAISATSRRRTRRRRA